MRGLAGLVALITFLSAAPSFAASYSGWAVLDWSALSMSGIDFTISNFYEQALADVASKDGFSSVFTSSESWGNSTATATIPSVGSATSSATTTELSASLSLLLGSASGGGATRRDAMITALDTGVLTISIPFSIAEEAQMLSGSWSSFTAANLEFSLCLSCPSLYVDRQAFSHFFDDNIVRTFSASSTGILALDIPLSQGETGYLNFDARSIAHLAVPIPSTLLPFLLGLVAFVVWRERATS